MAIENTDPKTLNPAANNAAVARQVQAQDIAGQSTVTGEFGEATEALDKLAAQVTPKPEAVVETPKPTAAREEPAAAAEPKPDAEAEKIKHRAEELFKDSPALPPNASPKSAEAFSAIKLRAAQDISAREQEIEALKAKLDAAGKPTPEVLETQRELEEHRQWRAKLDVDFDPKFKEYDKGISQSREFIYAQLAKSPAITPAVIEQIKKYGGPDMVNLAKIFESVKDPTLQRLVESKVADIEMAKYNRDQAVASAKTNVTQYLQERQTQIVREGEAGKKATLSSLGNLLGGLDWFAEKKPAADSDAAAKKEAEEHNEFLGTLKKQISDAVQDNSPEMRAILITGMAQLFNLQRRVPALEAQLAEATKRAGEATAKWEAVKKSSVSVLPESQAPAGGISGSQKKDANVNQRPGDALDEIARQVMEKRAAAQSGQ